MRVLALLVATLMLLLAGCGKRSLVAVRRPVKPIWICEISLLAQERACRDGFDAGSLVGLRLPAAERLAAAHGYKVSRVAPLAENEDLIADWESNRLDVETDSTGEQSTVVRFVERG
jgi:hypothetical protein